MVNGLTLSL